MSVSERRETPLVYTHLQGPQGPVAPISAERQLCGASSCDTTHPRSCLWRFQAECGFLGHRDLATVACKRISPLTAILSPDDILSLAIWFQSLLCISLKVRDIQPVLWQTIHSRQQVPSHRQGTQLQFRQS